MFCQNCGKEVPPGVTVCPQCHAAVVPPPPMATGAPGSAPSVDRMIDEVKRSAKDLATATAKLSRQIGSKAEAAAKDPSGAAQKVAHKVSEELDQLAKDIEKVLREI